MWRASVHRHPADRWPVPLRPFPLAARCLAIAVMFVVALAPGAALAHEGHELECEQTCGLGNFCQEHPQHKICQDDRTADSGELEDNEGSKVHDVEGSQPKASKKRKPQARSVREVPVGGVDAGGGQAEPRSSRNLTVFIAVVLAALTSLGFGLYRLVSLRS